MSNIKAQVSLPQCIMGYFAVRFTANLVYTGRQTPILQKKEIYSEQLSIFMHESALQLNNVI